MADSENEVPPLEDMSELVEQVRKIHGIQNSSTKSTSHKSTSTSIPVSTKSELSNKSVVNQQNGGEKTGDSMKKAPNTIVKKNTSSSFGGMKKGFLFGSSTKPKSSKKAPNTSTKACTSRTDIPLIKPKVADGSKRQHEIVEVQEAMKASTPLLQNTEWVTDDLLKKVDQHPRLLQQLSDPRITQAMAKFQRNPQLAMQEYQNDPEIQQFFKDFSSLLGAHFESLSNTSQTAPSPTMPSQTIRTQDSSRAADISVHSSTNPKQATSADESKIQEILNDPKVLEILQNKDIQRLFAVLRSNPKEAQRLLQQLDPQGKEKVQRLVDAGLLGFLSS